MHEYVGVEAKYGRIVDVNRHFIKREAINIERDSESGGTIELGLYRPIKISHEPHILDIPFRFYCLLPKSGTVAGGTVALWGAKGNRRAVGVRACMGVRAHARSCTPTPLLDIALIYIIRECEMHKYIDIMFHYTL